VNSPRWRDLGSPRAPIPPCCLPVRLRSHCALCQGCLSAPCLGLSERCPLSKSQQSSTQLSFSLMREVEKKSFTGGEAGGSLMDCKTGDGFKGSWAGRQNDDGGLLWPPSGAPLLSPLPWPSDRARGAAPSSSPRASEEEQRRNKLGNITKIQLKVTNDKFPSKRGWDAMPKKSNKNSTRATFLSANGMSQSRCCSLTAPSAGGGGCCRAAGPIAALSPLPDSPALTFPPRAPSPRGHGSKSSQ